MGVKLSMASQLKFFYDVLGQAFTDTKVKPLLDAGGTLNVEFTKLTAVVQGTQHELDLPCSTTLLMKGKAQSTLAEAASKKIYDWIYMLNKIQDQAKGHSAMAGAGSTGGGIGTWTLGVGSGGGGGGGLPDGVTVVAYGGGGGGGSAGGDNGSHVISGTVTIKAPEPDYLADLAKATGLPDSIVEDLKTKLGATAYSDDTMELLKKAAMAPTPFEPKEEEVYTAPKSKKATPKPVPPKVGGKVVLLRDATEIGQRVRGTDAHSVYTVVALSPHVKLAVRVLGNKISIRAEFPDASHEDESHKLAAMGLNMNSGAGVPYMSAHMQADGVTAGRVVGAFLFDCGIDFDQQMSTMKGLDHADHQ